MDTKLHIFIWLYNNETIIIMNDFDYLVIEVIHNVILIYLIATSSKNKVCIKIYNYQYHFGDIIKSVIKISINKNRAVSAIVLY